MFKNIIHRWNQVALTLVMILGILTINLAYSGQALAGDNYSAQTDTYQETRNPNRVDTTREELSNSKLNSPKDSQAGQSIYESVVDRVNQQRDTSIKGSSNTKTKSEP